MTHQHLKKALRLTRFDAEPYYPTIADCRRWTEILNHVMFCGQVPKYRRVTVRRLHKVHANCLGEVSSRGKRYCELEMNQRFDSFTAFYSVLAHELCHAAEWCEHGEMSHGRFFYSHREMLQLQGVKLQSQY